MEKLYDIDRDFTVRGNFYRFDNTAAIGTLKSYDEYAARDVARAYHLIEALKQYRVDLYAHHNYISGCVPIRELHFTRNKNYSTKKVSFTVQILQVFPGDKIRPYEEVYNRFTGRERREAYALFEKLKNENPGIKCVVDLAKKHWEK